MEKLRNLSILALFAAAIAIAPVGADDASGEEKHSHGAAHGGQVIELGNHQSVEMVTQGSEVSFYISEDDKPADLHGGSFRVFVQSGAAVMTATLVIKGNRLTAKLEKSVPAGAKVVVSGKDGHGHVVQARFIKK